jgi:hypothetical protein
VTTKKLRADLERLEKSELVDLLMAQVSESKTLKQRLSIDLAMAQPGDPNVRALRSVVDGAFRSKRVVDYRAMPAYARRCSEVIKQLDSLLMMAMPCRLSSSQNWLWRDARKPSRSATTPMGLCTSFSTNCKGRTWRRVLRHGQIANASRCLWPSS